MLAANGKSGGEGRNGGIIMPRELEGGRRITKVSIFRHWVGGGRASSHEAEEVQGVGENERKKILGQAAERGDSGRGKEALKHLHSHE